jgi:hypothetical protein
MALLFAGMMLANFFVFLCVRAAFLKDKNREGGGGGGGGRSYRDVSDERPKTSYTSKGSAAQTSLLTASDPSIAERV